MLRMLSDCQIRSTFFVPGYTARKYPKVIKAVAADGHEIGHHGYMHEPLIGKTAEQEAALLDQGLTALSEVVGVTPVGYRAPSWEMNWHTPGLLADRGFVYDSSLMNDDYPYELATGEGKPSIVELPINWVLDDWEQYCYIPDFSGDGMIANPAEICGMWRNDFDAVCEAGGLWILTNHPFLSGRPARARELRWLIEYVSQQPGVWIATLAEIASHVRGLGLEPRRLSKPVF